MEETQAVDAEKELAALIETSDEDGVISWLDGPKAREIEFTGRCLSDAIGKGMARAACLMGRMGFHLAVTDDPAAQRAISEAASMRGLLGFLERYRYCKAQRSYYLSVVESELACGSIAAMLNEDLLNETDKAELLSLSIRSNNAELARLLADSGALLAQDAGSGIPADLAQRANANPKTQAQLWAQFATPQRSLKMLEIVLEQSGGSSCCIHRSWWGSYQRQADFAAKLSVIACHSSIACCDCPATLLETLAAAGETKGLAAVVRWPGIDAASLDVALRAAQEAGHAQAAAIILGASQQTADALELLEF